MLIYLDIYININININAFLNMPLKSKICLWNYIALFDIQLAIYRSIKKLKERTSIHHCHYLCRCHNPSNSSSNFCI